MDFASPKQLAIPSRALANVDDSADLFPRRLVSVLVTWQNLATRRGVCMFAPDYAEVAKYAGSVGLLVDRCVKREQPFGTVWLVDSDKVATCAHLVVLFEDFLAGLKVRFPALGQDWEVVEAQYHPKFDRKLAMELAQRSLSTPVPALALQDQNLVILKLSRELSDLRAEAKTGFNKKISLAPLPRVKGLVGSVEELGLALVIQTMTNSRKDGILFITDERNRPTARLFCREGRVIYAKFGKLENEAAIYQMFSQDVQGQFNFRTQSKPDWPVTEPMTRSTDGLLLEAHRRMDEKPKLLEQLGGAGSAYARVTELMDVAQLPEEIRDDAKRVFPYLDGGIAVDQIWDDARVDDYAALAALVELRNTRQIVEIPAGDDGLNPMQPLAMAPHLLLSPWDQIVSMTVHPISGRPQLRRGSLVGMLRPNDPYHLLHTLNLPYKSAGSPLFKQGEVIGMHCGMLPLDPALHALPQHLHQLLWVESITQTLATKPVKKSIGMQRPPQPGEAERITCPKCTASMVKQAKFCGTCGHKLG